MNKIIDDFLDLKLDELVKKNLYNEIQPLMSPNGPKIMINNSNFINLSANNYLGFATNLELIKIANETTLKWGVGSGAVRTINGTLELHLELERTLAKFKGTEAAIVYQSGFDCNIGTIPAIMNKFDAILSDSLNHASIIDGIRLSKATVLRFNHSDMKDLEEKAKEAFESKKYAKIMIITDGVFSMDGDICKLPEIIKIAKKYGLITYIDDAHGSGVMGKGHGTAKHFNLEKEVDFQIGTLSKAIGVIGGYVAGSEKLIKYLKVTSRPFLFSTAITPSTAAVANAAIKILENEESLVEKLWDNANFLKRNLKAKGFDIGVSETPITPVIIGDEKLTKIFSQKLYENGVYAKFIIYPTVALGKGRIRNMPSAQHTKEQLQTVVDLYEKIGKELKIIKEI